MNRAVPSTSPVLQKCQKQRKIAKWFQIAYVVPFILFLAVPGNLQKRIIASTIVLGIFIFADLFANALIAAAESEERERMRKFAERMKNQARAHAHLQEAQKWLERCKAVGGLATVPSSYPCKRGECVLFTEEGVRVQETRKIRGPGGTTSDQWTTLDTGTLHVTNQRLIFVGDINTRNVAIKDIVSTKIYVDSFDVTSSKRAKPMGFLCANSTLVQTIVTFVQEHPDMKPISEILQGKNESMTEDCDASDFNSLDTSLICEGANRPQENAPVPEWFRTEELAREALRVIAQTGLVSTSTIQRKLRLGYNRAARIMDILEEKGFVGPATGIGSREILFDANEIDFNSLHFVEHSPDAIRSMEEYLGQLGDISSEMGSFIQELDGNPEIAEILGRVDGIDEAETLDIFAVQNAKLGFLIAEDMLKTWKGLGCSFEERDPFQFSGAKDLAGLAAGISQVVQTRIGLATEDWLDEGYQDHARKVLASIAEKTKGTIDFVVPEDQFLLPFVLSFASEGREWGQRFLTLLYRWASVVAKADRYIDKTEAEWLAKIVSAAGLSNAQAPRQGRVTADPALSAPMRHLAKMVGLGPVKAEVEKLANLVRIQHERERQGIKTVGVSYHCVFTGNPGTGKTTVARIVAGIYKDLGVLKKGHLVETDRAGLVAEYVGQTGPKTNKVIDAALDGVLFIDEAYSLVEGSKDDYGKEAIATLLKRMEDERSRLVVILAGYSEDMKRFIASNPGLQSRFNRYIHFPDYEAADLVSIFRQFAETSQYRLGTGAEEALHNVMERAAEHKDEHFGNGRFARNLFEKSIERQAMRLARVGHLSKEMLQELLPEDILDA